MDVEMADQATALAPWGALRDLYLALWEQLDVVSGENKWLDPRPPYPGELEDEVQRRIDQLEKQLRNPGMLDMIRRDRKRTQDLVGRSVRDPDFAEFKTYLRDEGLRYARAVRGRRS